MEIRNLLNRAGILAGKRKIKYRLFMAFLAMWLLPALLCAMQGAAAARSFISDCALHTRSLIAVPVLILGEYTCLPLLREIAQHFGDLARDDQRNRCEACIASVVSFHVPTAVIIGSTLCAYVLVLLSIRHVPLIAIPSWQKSVNRGHLIFSLAGWWHWLVSIPLLLDLIFLWLSRISLWSRFLWQMSRLHLRLVLSHPDKVGGLKFLGYSPVAFIPLSFALGAILAGMAANRVLHFGESLLEYKSDVIGLVVVVIVLFCSPLTFFAGRLFAARRWSILRYSGLANSIGYQFEQKWLHCPNVSGTANENVLEAPDFSATIDLYSIVNNVYQVQLIPLDFRSVILLVAAAILPFFPVALIQVPFRTIIERLGAMLM